MVLLFTSAVASTLVVDRSGGGDFVSIAAALLAAEDGDTIEVAPGSYIESVVLGGPVTLVSSSGPTVTTLVGATSEPVVEIAGGATLSGFTISHPGGTGVAVTSGVPTLEDLVFTGNGDYDDASAGSALVVTGGSLTVRGTTFVDNQAVEGGHAHVSGGAEVAFEACTFSRGEANRGGAVFVEDATVAILDTTLLDNVAGGDGGALHVRSLSTVTVVDSTFGGNRSIAAGGGAIVANGYSEVTLAGVVMENNTLDSWEDGFPGGAVRQGSGALSIVDTTFRANVAGVGGAIALDDVDLEISTSTFEDNVASGPGGAAWIEAGTWSDFGSDWSGNRSVGDSGGAIYSVDASASLIGAGFSGNAAGADGGAAQVIGGTLSADSCRFESNQAAGNGGGLAFSGDVAVTLGMVTMERNSAGGDGGGLFLATLGTAALDAGTFVRNEAFHGGGVAVIGTPAWSDRGSTFADNVGDGGGGSIYVAQAATLLVDTWMAGGLALPSDGGNLAIAGGTLDGTGVGMAGGVAGYNGGNLWISGATVTLAGLDVTDGLALVESGGGVFATGVGALVVSDAWIAGNRADRGGGVAVADRPDAGDTFTNVRFQENAARVGGGVSLAESAWVRFVNVDVLGNSAEALGGGMAVHATGVEVRNTLVAWNAGTGVEVTALQGASIFGWNLWYDNEGGDVGGELGEPPGEGNLLADPLFVDFAADSDPFADDLTLRASSPVRDAGDPSILDPDGSRSDIGFVGGPGASRSDADGDGWDLAYDCDDADAAVHPEAEDVEYDGEDRNCDGLDYDADGDGRDAEAWGGDDCDDSDPWIWTGCEESGAVDTGDTGDSGVTVVPGTGVYQVDECGCGGAGPIGGFAAALAALAATRRRTVTS